MNELTSTFACMAISNLTAIVQSQREDADVLVESRKGKQREGELSDAELALNMYLDELSSCEEILRDRTMAQSIALAVLRDGSVVEKIANEERQIAEDHGIATTFSTRPSDPSGDETNTPKAEEDSDDPWKDDELLAKVQALYIGQIEPCKNICFDSSDDDTVVVGQPETSKRGELRDEGKKKTGRCVACGDEKEFFDVARVPCNHEYCRPCLEELFRLSIKDETLFPPRCDGKEIALNKVRFFLSSQLATDFEARYQELSTKNRTYCYDPECSAFIPSSLIKEPDIASCPQCHKTTCIMCKSQSHIGDCPEDSALQSLIATAESEQWQRCFQCRRFVALEQGCNHMTCHCRAEFCYECGLEWKTCSCVQWREDRLVERATEIVDREPQWQEWRVDHAAEERRLAQIAEEIQNLRDNHVCEHERWRWRGGRHTCEECMHRLPEYIFECRQCRILACNRCRRNRL